MYRPVKSGEIFTTFIFDGKDCADMGVYSVTNSGTYDLQMTPNFSDEFLSVPAYDGQYYYGTQFTTQQFNFTLYADNLSAQEYRNLKAWLYPRKVGRLILSDQPYKYYIVKLTSVGNLGNYPMVKNQLSGLDAMQNPEDNVVYTGKFTVTFQTVGSVYGYGLSYYRDDLIYDALNYHAVGIYPENYFYDSGLLYRDMAPDLNRDLPANAQEVTVTWYNPGTAPCTPELKINYDGTFPSNSYIQINNNSQNATTIVNLSNIKAPLIIDPDSEIVKDADGLVYYGKFSGNLLSVSNDKTLLTIDEADEDNNYNIYITHVDDMCFALINPNTLVVNEGLVGKYLCINGNGGAKIIGIDADTNSLIISTENKDTYDIMPATLTRPAGFACNFVGKFNTINDLPSTSNVGDVAQLRDTGKMMMYKYDKWNETNLFTSDEEFLDETEHYVTRYLMFGANIIGLDDITVNTNIDACNLEVSLLPRYI